MTDTHAITTVPVVPIFRAYVIVALSPSALYMYRPSSFSSIRVWISAMTARITKVMAGVFVLGSRHSSFTTDHLVHHSFLATSVDISPIFLHHNSSLDIRTSHLRHRHWCAPQQLSQFWRIDVFKWLLRYLVAPHISTVRSTPYHVLRFPHLDD